ncbi:ABC transporter ATP-binding protein [Staphylococcus taiwanensis]|nr:ABC transporter ATP-binding protein [Staphylococcus taiwanensis]
MLITLNNISRKKQGRCIINNINWQIREGDKWILYGMNGAGKTTLLNIFNAYEPITNGQIQLFGMEPGKIGFSADKVRAQIGYVSGSLLNKFPEGEKVIDIVISGAFKSIGVYKEVSDLHIKQAQELLEIVGMNKYEQQYLGYLSTGQQQSVMIARALMSNPKLIILDEPASGLDFLARENLFKVIEDLSIKRPELSIIYVTHFVEEIIPIFNKIFLLKDGKCFGKGLIPNILTNDMMSRLFERQIEVINRKQRYALYLKD